MVKRTQKDEIVTDKYLKSRGEAFELLNESFFEQLENPKLVSSAYGKIEEILLTIPDWVFEYDAYFKVYQDLIQNFGKDQIDLDYANRWNAPLLKKKVTTKSMIIIN